MKLHIILIIIGTWFFSAYGAFVERSTAETAAVNWIKSVSEQKTVAEVSDYTLFENAVHIFNFKNGGFVLIAAEDASKPVLGYSTEGYFGYSPEKENINFWLGLYTKAVKEIRENNLSNDETLKEWNSVLSNSIEKGTGKAVPQLMTSTWNQSPIYNMYCPMDGGSLSVVGCVATAMSQIMYYHKYPATGKDSHSYSILDQNLSVDYYLSRYNWDIMVDALSGGSSDEAKHEVAQISYHAGVAVEMMYGADGSGAYSTDVPYAFKTYFKYGNSTSYISRNSYSDTNWTNIIKAQHDQALPVYYSGYGDGGGHAFVTDGYDDSDMFHFNWGWGGYADGYFSLSNLNPGGSAFNEGQAIVMDIIPKTTDLVLSEAIPDIQTDQNVYEIDLSNYFTSLTGDGISYTVSPKSDINDLEYSITSGVLTLTKLSDGISHIVITGTTRNDNNFDDFYFQFGSGSLKAGFGNSYNFNSTAYLDAGNSDQINSVETISVSTWLKLNSVNIEQGIASKAETSSSGWYLTLQSNNLLKFSLKVQDGNTRRIYSDQPLQENIWYHIDAVYDGKDLMIYIDGELDNIKTTYPDIQNISHDSDANLLIGNAYSTKFDGEMDEVVIWNKAVTESEIREIMGKKPDISSMQGIVAYWPLNEGFYDTAEDKTGFNSGTFVGNDLANWNDSSAPLYFFAEENTALDAYLAGDEDPSSVYNITSDPVSGSVELTDASAGAFTYTPAAGFTGIDEMKYTITYSDKTTSEKTVMIKVSETSGIEENSSTPVSFELFQNYPNPFNPATQIRFALTDKSDVRLSVYNISGQLVSELAKGVMEAGLHTVEFDGGNLNSGVYYYTLEADGKTMTNKMVLTK